jgi:uncharacterized protein YbaR (Trm112 family)
LRPADAPLLEKLNQQIAAGQLRNRAGTTLTEPMESGLIRADGKYLYPVRRSLPIMLVDEGIEVGD